MSQHERAAQRAWDLQSQWDETKRRAYSARGVERIRLLEQAAALREAFWSAYHMASTAPSLI